MMTEYVAAMGGMGPYGIVFYDFPGCTAVGDTPEEAIAAAREAVEGHIAVMRDHGEPIPYPTPYATVFKSNWLKELDPEGEEHWVGYEVIEITEAKQDVHVDLPRTLIRELSAATPDARGFIIDATRRELERLKKTA